MDSIRDSFEGISSPTTIALKSPLYVLSREGQISAKLENTQALASGTSNHGVDLKVSWSQAITLAVISPKLADSTNSQVNLSAIKK